MKRTLVLIALLLASFSLFAQDAEVVYVDYEEVEIRRASGVTIVADFGDMVRSGESVITTPYGGAELELADGGSVRISPNTVYTVQEIETDEGPQTFMSVAVGAVAFRFNRLAGRREPAIGTPTAVAGVRGTAFTVIAAIDGSSIFVVDEGEVAVSSKGRTVSLTQNRGVEVLPGEAPGEPFDALERAIDFSTYNQQRFDSFLADPVTGVRALGERLEEMIEQIEILKPLYDEAKAELDRTRGVLEEMREDEDVETEAVTAYFDDEVTPIRIATGNYYDNLRFYALSALSMRRYVLGRMYVAMTLEDLDGGAQNYDEFVRAYRDALRLYERHVAPVLIPTDI